MNCRGFTLLEVLVALSIFAVIGLAANTMLRSAVDTNDRIGQSAAAFANLQRAVTLIDRDFRQLSDRAIRGEDGDPAPPLQIPADIHDVEFTRRGWRNPLGLRRSGLQRVAYRLVEGDLIRSHWAVLDRGPRSEPHERVIMSNVSSWRVTVIDADGERLGIWPPVTGPQSEAGGTAGVPALAVEVVLGSDRFGEVRRVYPAPFTARPLPAAGGPGAGSGDATGAERAGETGDGEP